MLMICIFSYYIAYKYAYKCVYKCIYNMYANMSYWQIKLSIKLVF